jgi:multisubunit Na+/H+ antiporter MnhB subunit
MVGMNATVWALPLSLGVFAGIIILLDTGYRVGRRQSGRSGHEGLGAIEAAVFGLLGLLLAFSFSGAASRLDFRRQLIVQEANAIGTAYLRLDLLAAGEQAEIRPLFREYLEARLRVYQVLPDLPAAEVEMERAAGVQQKIWSKAVAASRADSTSALAIVLLPAINEMIDITTTRSVALRTHLPTLISVLLIGVALLSAFLAGYAMAYRGRRSWLHIVVYALSISLTIYVVIDLDYPRSGLVRLDAADSDLAKLRDSIR